MTLDVDGVLDRESDVFKGFNDKSWERMTSSVEDRDGHWFWTGQLTLAGYPTVSVSIDGNASTKSPAKLIYEAAYGHPGFNFRVFRTNCTEKTCVMPQHRRHVKSKVRTTRTSVTNTQSDAGVRVLPKANRTSGWKEGAVDYLKSL